MSTAIHPCSPHSNFPSPWPSCIKSNSARSTRPTHPLPQVRPLRHLQPLTGRVPRSRRRRSSSQAHQTFGRNLRQLRNRYRASTDWRPSCSEAAPRLPRLRIHSSTGQRTHSPRLPGVAIPRLRRTHRHGRSTLAARRPFATPPRTHRIAQHMDARSHQRSQAH
jgi:hypothetical protein